MPPIPAKPLIQNGRIALHSAPNGDVIHRKAALRHHFLQITVAERVAQIPPTTENDDQIREVPPSEQRWSLLAH